MFPIQSLYMFHITLDERREGLMVSACMMYDSLCESDKTSTFR